MESVGRIGGEADRKTSHNLHIASEATSYGASWKTDALITEFVGDVFSGKYVPDWLMIEKAMDCTPIEVEFGELEPLLFDVARYKHVDGEGRFSLLTYEEAQRLSLRCKRGVIEMLAQTTTLVWPQDAASLNPAADPDLANGKIAWRVERPISGPVYLERANSSNEWACHLI